MRHLATIEIIQDIQPIENADFIEKPECVNGGL
mgnify:CR=1 FL=1